MTYSKLPFLILILTLFFTGCNNDDDFSINNQPDPIELSPNVEVYNSNLVENSYVFAIENGGTKSYLLNKAGFKVYEWELDTRLGNDLEILPDGRLIGMFKVDDPIFTFGGGGGIVKILNIDGTVDWEYEYASENYIAHHDVELLPNGNVMFLVWERIPMNEAIATGVDTDHDIFTETLIEVNPTSNQIVWEWHSFDHIIQDQFPALPNFGNLTNNPNLININYNIIDNGDIMHANGIDHDPLNNVIYISVNYYSEVWVIDHSTTTAQAATSEGGNYNKGGNLLYRFGNPETYNNVGERLFYNNHFANILENNVPGNGNVLIYMNGSHIEQSTVYEFEMPSALELTPNVNNEPTVVWSFTDDDLFYGRISGAVRLQNGNTLICEGDFGFWEVSPLGEIAWKYSGDDGTSFWRCYNYNLDDSAITDLGL
ncbi:aryl-sulfate sulfotransferase [Hanstruepera marina]|uniref:aryl-sulfate sulfotransferase n=1 Tax=Hanstruepera marina TaxID=2873265 RepID=UPI001CA5F5BD|nr:aryl-sulfate sulfotransferase [Hanstruepera marina]